MKKVEMIRKTTATHWVGDGFLVRGMMGYSQDAELNSPFLLLDYAGPYNFEPTQERRGVGQHPHRGFETVTIVYDGEVSHKDSLGNEDTIGPGDVQWMTAAGGILHEEYHSDAYAAKGGPFRMVQLWVNLPKKDKLSTPHYQAILDGTIPQIALKDDAGSLRVIAGTYDGAAGPADTFSPINVWDVTLKAGADVTLPIPQGHTSLMAVLEGNVSTGDGNTATEAELVRFERKGDAVHLTSMAGAKLLVLTGMPLNEPVYGYGPFVMTNEQEIRDAIEDLRLGRFVPDQPQQAQPHHA